MNGEQAERATNGRRSGLVIRLPWGVVLEVRGLSIIMAAVLVVVGLTLIGVFLHDRDSQTILLRLLSEQVATKEAQIEFTYVITLPQEKREALKLQMPDTLRKKLAQQQ